MTKPTRGRKEHAPAEPIKSEINTAELASASRNANTLAMMERAADQQALQLAEIFTLVGRFQAAQFMETVSARMMAETYTKVKAVIGRTGGIKVPLRDGTVGTVSDMESFCEAAMPVSARRCRQIVSAMDTLGPELYEQAERLGFRTRDYKMLRALPDDDRRVVEQAIEAGDKDTALEELAARNAALRKQVAEAKATAEAKDRVIASDKARISELQEQQARRQSLDPTEREAAVREELRDAALEAEVGVRRLLAVAARERFEPTTEATQLLAGQMVDFVAQVFAELSNQAGLSIDFTELVTPSWARPDLGLGPGDKAG